LLLLLLLLLALLVLTLAAAVFWFVVILLLSLLMILSSCGEPTPLVTSSSLGGHGDSANKAGLKSKAKKQSNQAGIRKKNRSHIQILQNVSLLSKQATLI
jgi:hypothetical protein